MKTAQIVATLTLILASFARGSGFAIELEVSAGKDHHTARSGHAAPRLPVSRRESFTGSAGSQFTMSWTVVRSARDTATDVLVHCYVVRLDRPGEAPPALDPKRVVIESALTMDFPRGETAKADLPFHIEGPGVYLIRVEAGGDADAGTAGEFAEIELVAK